METLKYKGEGMGAPAEVEVPGCGIVRRGGQLDVPDEIAEKLLVQAPENWERKRPAVAAIAESETGEGGD